MLCLIGKERTDIRVYVRAKKLRTHTKAHCNMGTLGVQRDSNMTSPPLKKKKQVDLRQTKNNVSATLQPLLFITEEI